MPVDEWKKANDRRRFGPVGSARTAKPPKKTRASRRGNDPAKIAARMNSHSHMLYGRYKDQELGTIPVDYWRWWLWAIGSNPQTPYDRALAAWLCDRVLSRVETLG